ncbi:glycosyltransferase [Paenibacillus sp. GYB003]|uniref:glycosyltransferase n=1 Tax=Paenibacillus sp. GYB003 TaxID=2994392 RepID=UPI002F969213
MKIALVHDYLNQYGGAERVLEVFMEMFPDAPVYTLIANLSKMPERFKEADIRTSFIQSIPFSKNHYKKMLGLFPIAVEQMDLRNYDLVLSSSSAFVKGVLTTPSQIHVCYCHTPMRYVWDLYHQYMQEITNPVFSRVLPYILHKVRIWDQVSSQRPDYYISNSHNVSKRIQKYYNRNSHVIHPPVSFSQTGLLGESEDFYLIVSRLLPYKRIDLVIETFNQLEWPLVIIGDGYDRQRLERLAGPTVKMLGYQSDAVIHEHYSKCKAFILAGEEDFGITPLEAQAHGKPVIAFGKGGALETVKDGVTGVFFDEQTVESLIQALNRLQNLNLNPAAIRDHADSFNENRFKKQIMDFIHDALSAKSR